MIILEGQVLRKKNRANNQTFTCVAVFTMYLICLATPAFAFNNNGFETDWIYALKTSTSELSAYRESDGAIMDTLLPPFPGYPSPNHISDTCYDAWVSLTFSGTLANNDARLYAAGEIPRQDGDCGGSQHPDDIVIIEVGPEGCSFDGSDARKRVYLKDLLGVSQVGSHVRLGTLRFSHFHNTLFISIDKDYTNRLSLVYIYEIDLELSTILNTYTGASVHRHEPMMDIDPTNGKIYVTESRMGEPYSEDSYGDLIEIDTSGGSTGVFTTLIDGPTYNATDSRWSGPRCPVYRGYNNPDGRPTFILPFNLSSDCVTLEFYLDANDGNYPPAGNLICRGEPYVRPTNKAAWRGRLDQISGTVMIPRLFDGTAGIDLVEADDSTRRIVSSYGFQDVASPGVKTQTSPPTPAGKPQIDPADPYRFLMDGNPWYPAGYYPALGAITLRWDGVAADTYYRALIDTLYANGINLSRLQFTMGAAPEWGSMPQSTPYVVVGTVNKNGIVFGQVDLDQFNQAHFDLWHDLILYAQSKGVVIQLSIIDSWHTITTELPWWDILTDFYAPGMNVNGLAISNADDWHTTNPADAVWQRHTAMIEEVVDQFGDLPNIIWEIANEPRFYYDNYNYGDIIHKEAPSVTPWTVTLGNHLKSYELSTRGYNHVCIPVDLHDHQKTPGQRAKWRLGYTDGDTPSGTRRDYLYIQSLTDGGDPRFPARPMITDNDGGGYQEINERRAKAWSILTARGHFDYFHFDINEYANLSNPDATDGMRYLGYTAKFINDLSVNLTGMVPRDDLVTNGWCLARSGQEYVIYLISGGSTTVTDLLGVYTTTWFNPRNGTTLAATGGPTFTAPDSNDWVLHIAVDSVVPEYVNVDFGYTDIKNGLNRLTPEPSNANTEGATIGGRECRKNVDSGDRHFFMQVSDSWAFEGNKPVVDVTIEYYDSGTDGIRLVYDGTAGDTNAGVVNFTDTNTWKSHTWNLTDAYFGNRSVQGSDTYDFRLSNVTSGYIFYIDTVTIAVPELISSDFDGDGDVDQEDFGFFQQCYSGLLPYAEGCEAADLDGTGNIDLDDFIIFHSCIGGANQPPGC